MQSLERFGLSILFLLWLVLRTSGLCRQVGLLGLEGRDTAKGRQGLLPTDQAVVGQLVARLVLQDHWNAHMGSGLGGCPGLGLCHPARLDRRRLFEVPVLIRT